MPENLFSGKMPLMTSYLSMIRNMDYVCFFKKDSVMEMHENFCENNIYKIKEVLDETIYLKIALNEERIKKSKHKESSGEVYRVLHIISGDLQNICRELEIFITEIDKKDRRGDWSRDKWKIANGYLGVYSSDLEKFFKKHCV